MAAPTYYCLLAQVELPGARRPAGRHHRKLAFNRARRNHQNWNEQAGQMLYAVEAESRFTAYVSGSNHRRIWETRYLTVCTYALGVDQIERARAALLKFFPDATGYCGPYTESAQAAALNNFDSAWLRLREACGASVSQKPHRLIDGGSLENTGATMGGLARGETI